MAAGGAGCVWSSYLGNGELEFFAKGTADHQNAHERLILIRQAMPTRCNPMPACQLSILCQFCVCLWVQ